MTKPVVVGMPRSPHITRKSLFASMLYYTHERVNVGTPGHRDHNGHTIIAIDDPFNSLDSNDELKVDPNQNYLKFNQQYGKLK